MFFRQISHRDLGRASYVIVDCVVADLSQYVEGVR
jgi:hypothetical protein